MKRTLNLLEWNQLYVEALFYHLIQNIAVPFVDSWRYVSNDINHYMMLYINLTQNVGYVNFIFDNIQHYTHRI